MPRKVNRRKYKIYKESAPAPSPEPSPASSPEPPVPPHQSFLKKLFDNTNSLLKKHPYIIFIIPIVYELYKTYPIHGEHIDKT